MKQKVLLILLTASLLTGVTAKKETVGSVCVSTDYTYKQLTQRKRKAQFLIWVEYGKCIDSKGNGRTDDNYYVSYRNTKAVYKGKTVRVRKGDRVKTLLVYDPLTTGEDDIILRRDFIIYRK